MPNQVEEYNRINLFRVSAKYYGSYHVISGNMDLVKKKEIVARGDKLPVPTTWLWFSFSSPRPQLTGEIKSTKLPMNN